MWKQYDAEIMNQQTKTPTWQQTLRMCTWYSFICYVSTFLPLYLSVSLSLSVSLPFSRLSCAVWLSFFLHLHDVPLSFCRPHSSTSDVSVQSSSILSHSFFTSALLKKNSFISQENVLSLLTGSWSMCQSIGQSTWLSECVCVFGMSFVSECAQIQAFSSAHRGIAEETLALCE